MAIQEINVPDIGDFDTVEIIEVLVNVGDEVSADDSIITLESDKASMEIPSPVAGKITDIKVEVGGKVAQGDLILSIETSDDGVVENTTENTTKKEEEQEQTTQTISKSQTITVPDIGDFDTVEIIELLVNVGDEVSADDSIITLESDKASMEIPSPVAGKITSIKVEVGEKVKQGDDILIIETTGETAKEVAKEAAKEAVKEVAQTTQKPAEIIQNTQTQNNQNTSTANPEDSHAAPSTRKLARELGVDLATVGGSGEKGRITEEDLKGFVKNAMQNGGSNNGGSGIPQIPSIDFAKFGEVEEVELSRINKISGKHLSSCWLNIPHVTQFDEANIDELEVFRKISKIQRQ
jgi:pyruvate dehydrogenase E2 component (dihydrolipoamide acetyltransferase)